MTSGVDINNDNTLDASEVDNTKQICFTQGAILDKVIMIPFPDAPGNIFYSSTRSVIAIDKFNKNDYPGVDSIVFVCHPSVYGAAGGTVTIQLFNLTNNSIVANSALTSNVGLSTELKPIEETKNLYSSLPNHTISLGITVTLSNTTSMGSLGTCALYLYRK